jgi:hypothetical protein
MRSPWCPPHLLFFNKPPGDELIDDAAAALDKGVELEAVVKKVICSTEYQNKARVGRNEYRKFLGTEYIRELVLK